MKKVIPEVVTYHCDRCEKEVSRGMFDCSGKAAFVGREFSGAAVGGNEKSFDFCPKCTTEFSAFLEGLGVLPVSEGST